MANTAAAPARAPLSTTKVQIRVNENVTLDNLHAIMARVVGIHGCLACGLLGIDLHIAGDPPEAKQLQGLPGVASANIG